MHAWLTRRWYRPDGGAGWLAPLAWLHRGLLSLRALAYRRGWLGVAHARCPVIVVGNVTVGGTGKTPVTLWLARELSARGVRVGVISRGYGGSATAPQRVERDADPAVVGDEPALIAARGLAQVAIAPRRIDAARLLDAECDILVADDGLQHLALARDVELAVIDGRRGLGNGWLLPAGPLREPASRLERVDRVLVNGGEWPGALRFDLEPLAWVPVGAGDRRPVDAFAGHRAHAIAGIGDPTRFFDAVRSLGAEVVEHPFPDHHRYRSEDLAFGDDLPLLMTEKDAVKCRRLGDAVAGRCWYLEVEARFSPPAAAELMAVATAVLPQASSPPGRHSPLPGVTTPTLE